MSQVAEQNSPLKKAVASWAKSKSTQHYEAVRAGQPAQFNWQFSLAQRLIFSKVHKALGLERAAATGGLYTAAAPISMQTLKYFESLDMHLMEGYGATENMGMTTCGLPGKSSIPLNN